MAHKLFPSLFVVVIFLAFASSATGQMNAEIQNFQDIKIWKFLHEEPATVVMSMPGKEPVTFTIGKVWRYENQVDKTMTGYELAGIDDPKRVICKFWGKSASKTHYYAILFKGRWITGSKLDINVNHINLEMVNAELTVTMREPVARSFTITIPNPSFHPPPIQLPPPQQPKFQPIHKVWKS